MNRDEWEWVALRIPVVRHLVRYKDLSDPPPTFYAVKHRSASLWITDPYRLRATTGDPASSWGKHPKRWRWYSQKQVEWWVTEHQSDGVIVAEIPNGCRGRA